VTLSRLEQLLGLAGTRRRLVATLAVVAIAALWVAGITTDIADEPAAVAYALPVAVLAIALGPALGALAGAVAGLLFWIADATDEEGLSAELLAYRSLALAGLGLLCGALAHRAQAVEQEVAASERRLAEAQRIAHIGSWEWDVRSGSLHWSEELRSIYGVDPGAPTPSYEGFLELVHPDDRELVTSTIESSFATRQPFEFRHRLVRGDGSVRTLDGNGEVFVDGHEVVRMAGTGHDVTERVEVELRLAAETELRARAVELNDAIVQGLALAGYHLQAGQHDAAAAALATTLDRAKSIVGDLIDRAGVEPGSLRRHSSADGA
jgi:PAS domain S-box-containing protein